MQAAQSRQQQAWLQQQRAEQSTGQQPDKTAKDAISNVAAATPDSSKEAMATAATSESPQSNGGPQSNGSSKQGSRGKKSKQKAGSKR